MFVVELIACTVVIAQDPVAASPSPFDQVVEITLDAGDPPLEDSGPAQWISYRTEFSGALHLWTTSELDLSLRVEDSDGNRLGEDEDSGGGATPYLGIVVEPGTSLRIEVACSVAAASGEARLFLLAAPETEVTRAAYRRMCDSIAELRDQPAGASREEVRRRLSSILDELLATEGAAWSERIARGAYELVYAAREAGELVTSGRACAAVLAHEMRVLPADHPELLVTREMLAMTLFQLGEHVKARALQTSVVEAYDRTLPPEHESRLRARGNLAVILEKLGDFAAAREHHEAIVATLERILPEDHPELLRNRLNLATALSSLGDHAGCGELERSVLEAYERTLPADHPALLRARGSLALTMQHGGDLAGARALQEAVLEAWVRTQPEDHPGRISAEAFLATTMGLMGDLLAARALKEAVLDARERTLPENHQDILRARQNLANTMLAMGDNPGALALFESTLEAFERILPADHPDLVVTRANLATSLKPLGELERARALEETVLEIYERTLPADHRNLHAARLNLAETLARMGETAGARALVEQVLEILERTRPALDSDLCAARLNLALCLRAGGDLEGARALEEATVASLEQILSPDHHEVLLARSNLCQTIVSMGDRARAIPEAEKLASGLLEWNEALSILSPREVREVARGFHPEVSLATWLLDPVESKARGDLAFALIETWRRAVAAPLPTLDLAAPAVRDRRDQLLELREELNDLVAGGARPGQSPEEFTAEVSRLSLERDRLERRLRETLGEQGISTRRIGVKEVAVGLGNDAAAIGYRRLSSAYRMEEGGGQPVAGDRLIAHVVRPDGSLRRVDLGEAAELEELVASWRAALGKPIERGLALEQSGDEPEQEAGEILRARVLDPVLEELGEQTVRLHVCLDDFLHLVALDVLPLGDGRVGDRWGVVNEISFGRLISPVGAPEGATGMLVVGGVSFSADIENGSKERETEETRGRPRAGFSPLLQTRFEAEAASVLFEETHEVSAAMLMKKEATKAAFHQHAPGKRFLHLATHGWFAAEGGSPARGERADEEFRDPVGATDMVKRLAPSTLCGLAFAGANRGRDSLGRVPGILTAEELAGVDLCSCELAVLSACETNVGIRQAGLGIQSLQSALHAAGARTAITSLWKVDDAATRQLMELFYTYLWLEEMDKAEALWRAKCDLRVEGHPARDWAAWVLSGDPE